MNFKRVKEMYDNSQYEPLSATGDLSKKFVFKFRSYLHYISYVKSLDNEENKDKYCESNKGSSRDSDFKWTQSKNLPDAFDVIASQKLNTADRKKLSNFVVSTKKVSRYNEDGYELEVPEYVAGAERYFLDANKKKTFTKIVDKDIFISATYNSSTNSELARKIGIEILLSIYETGVIPRKIIVAFISGDTYNINYSGQEYGEAYTFVDLDFKDVDSIVKMLHPSAFRRLWFRIAEIRKDLSWGYGSIRHLNTKKDDPIIRIDKMQQYTGKEFKEKIKETFSLINK